MWQLLKAEIRYNALVTSLFLMGVPLIFLVALRYREGGATFFGFILLFLMVNTWYALQIKEKRDFQHIQLPLAARQIGAARMLMVFVMVAVFICLFALLHTISPTGAGLNARVLLTAAGLVVAVYSLAFMFRDRFLGSKHLMRGKLLLVALLGGTLILNLATFAAMERAKEQGAEPPAIFRLFDFVEKHNPTTSNLNTAILLVVSLVLACLTIETFARRRSQI